MDAIDVELDHVFSTRIDLRISTPVLGIDYAGKKTVSHNVSRVFPA